MVSALGTGWFADPATPDTPVALDAAQVRTAAETVPSLADLSAQVSVCRACPRLVAWREEVARTKRRSFAAEPYWGRPVPGFGADRPRILVLGLAPAAHGANRTGRNFTGDRSGEWLYAALYRAGLANQPTSERADDGLRLVDTRVVAAVRCAPPGNQPTPAERDTCRSWLVAELRFLRPGLRSIVVLGGFAWAALWPAARAAGLPVPARPDRFGHGVRVDFDGLSVFGCYHVSQQNTFTGRLTEPMLDAVLAAALAHTTDA